MKKIKLLLVCLMVAVSAVAFAQSRTVKGQVTSADDGLPIIGASVFVQGTSTGLLLGRQPEGGAEGPVPAADRIGD